MKSNRILTIVLAVTITPFAAVAQARTASKDGATTPKAPVLASVRGSDDAAELNDILEVPTPVPLGPADILDQYEQAMAATAQGFNVEVSRIADAVQQKAITEQQGESLCKEPPFGSRLNQQQSGRNQRKYVVPLIVEPKKADILSITH